MASNCYDLWRVHQNSKGQKKWINEGRAPDGECPDCPQSQYPAAGTWNGYSARCQNGSIYKVVANGTGGSITGDIIVASTHPRAIAACNGSTYQGTGPISNYF